MVRVAVGVVVGARRRRRKINKFGFMIDIHAHILPGIDDGARTLEDSVALVRELAAAMGVTEVVATPHYVDETIYASPRTENMRLMRKLQQELDKAGVDVKIHLGNEIYINDKIAKLIKEGLATTMTGSRYLLVELPMSGEYPGGEDILVDLMHEGYKVILAHPERYATVQRDFKIVQDLYGMGVLMQCNLGSVVGKYGKHARKVVRKMAKEGLIFAFGSDIHHVQGEEYWVEVQKKLRKCYDEEGLERVLTRNASEIVGM